MKLDRLQKEEFMNYWGRCPMLDSSGNLCHVEIVEKVGKENFSVIYYKYHVEDERHDLYGNLRANGIAAKTNDLEQFNPYFVETGFYQLHPNNAYWINRKPERSRRKGMHHDNVDILGIKHIQDKITDVQVWREEFSLKDISRIYYNKLVKYPAAEESLDSCIARLSSLYGKSGFSIALSRNVALVSSAHDIPVVFYKMNPVGYFLDNKVLLHKKKAVSIETISEETGIAVETYEG